MRIYIWIFLNIRGPMCSWETHILAYLTSFYWNNVAHHLWSNLQTCKFFGGDKEFECTKCKASFKKNFQHFWPIYAFLVRMTVCTSHIKSFPWHQWPNWPQWPQQPQWPQWAHDPHFVKNLWFKVKNVYFWWFVKFYNLKKAPKSQNIEKKTWICDVSQIEP